MAANSGSSSPYSKPPSPLSVSQAPSPASTPNSSRPPSPMTRPAAAGGIRKGGLNALSGGSMAFTCVTPKPVQLLKKQDHYRETKSSLSSDDESDVDENHPPRPPKTRRSSSGVIAAAMAPYVTEFELYEPQTTDDRQYPIQKIAVVGSGSWGTALARIAALNAAEKKGFHHEVRMWVREREIPGQGRLTEVINSTHENHRYLPEVPLPHNLVAVSGLTEVVKNATLIVLVVPHQFLIPVLDELSKPGVLTPGARAISAIKGVEVAGDEIYTFPWLIEKKLGIPCSALGGANIAMEVAQSEFCETTIGVPSPDDAALWHAVFDSPMFRVHPIEDVAGVSLSGALKNVVALAAGFVDGMGYGGNTKAAILRIGLLEMAAFTKEFFPASSSLTFSHHSAGVADLITTSFGGRNRKCAEAFIKTGKSFAQLENELLKGQKLQGVVTAEEIYKFLQARRRTDGYPLFTKVYKISFESMDAKRLFDDL
ncbi:hypothetical protein D9757_007380 [Collybiopsis confluens]|uniref:Glycerol-3-phosphate dehydrogenase [NAD(+)] n=1 Tax=Collybiopsis confluens TaxID=2823264 RepID=A0A8H5HIT4_9AGAR|nr:hypothetical protein D9757_007380 [Collybiopsis confluens]